jgi:hypothetical protein
VSLLLIWSSNVITDGLSLLSHVVWVLGSRGLFLLFQPAPARAPLVTLYYIEAGTAALLAGEGI